MFGASQLWGKVDRAFLRVICERQYLGHEFRLDPALRFPTMSSSWCIDHVSRKVVDAVIFTDGFTPDPIPENLRLSAPRQFTAVVPPSVKKRWLHRRAQIVPVEMLAAVLALETFSDRIKGADILLLIDSEAVEL